MNVLLFSMPDSFEHTAPVAICIPNAALTSLAGNVDGHHRVAVADLVLAQGRVAETVERLVREHEPDVIGLSVMTFQRRTAFRLVERLRGLRPGARIVVGGYDPSLATDAWTGDSPGVDFVVRGEGEETFSDLLRALETNGPLAGIRGCRSEQTAASGTTRPGRSGPSRTTRCGCRTGGRACSAATRCSAGPSTSSRPRAAARSTAASARSWPCGAATSTAAGSSA